MNQDRSLLLDSVRHDPSTRPPYFWHHMRPDAQQWGILEIWRRARPETEHFFNIGGYRIHTMAGHEHYYSNHRGGGYVNATGYTNWVANWLLYSVFRSRDVRNNRNRRRDHQHRDDVTKSRYYDPVRNG